MPRGAVRRRQSRLWTVPISLAEAKEFVDRVHRHHDAPVGHKFSTGVVDDRDRLRGVAVLSRPVARRTDRRQVLEVTRVATDGCPNACSALYGQCCRIGKALGYRKCQTFTLAVEPGTSLFAAGWRPVGTSPGRPWNGEEDRARRVRPKTLGLKIKWECRCSELPAIRLEELLSA